MIRIFLTAILVLSLALKVASAQPQGFNYDESRVPEYSLPDPLTALDGSKVTTRDGWAKRRAEILELFRREMFGRSPAPKPLKFETIEISDEALDGKAIRKQVRITFDATNPSSPSMDLLIYAPRDKAARPAPAFLGLNFHGNHTIHPDPRIVIPDSWVRKSSHSDGNRATESGRGVSAGRWPVEMILERGYAVATIYYGDIDPDFDDGFKNGVHSVYAKQSLAGDDWGSIATWAWGLSRAMDYLEKESLVDAKHVAVLGHSRLGKTSLWAGAEDSRFGVVISNNSGCGGAALSRRRFGETVKRINTSFPHWFCDNFLKYNDHEDQLPLDQHMLIALAAPRPVYVASAVEDRWADPRGEFLSLHHAEPVYRLLGKSGLDARSMPAVDKPAVDYLGYHIRSGKHDVTRFDWKQYLDFADKHFKP